MSNSTVFPVVLLTALPASGKSEVRNFLAHMPQDRLEREFHFGDTLQLDDFPYVYFMRLIDGALERRGLSRVYYPGEEPFIDGRDWGTLVNLLNEDYHDLMGRVTVQPASAARYLMERMERASAGVGIPARLGLLPADVLDAVADELEGEARAMLDAKHAAYPDSFEGKTVIIEMARGGPDGSAMPLTGTFGYQYTLPVFCPEILEKAVMLYIKVTPEESRRKNSDRADPDDPGSNLHHGVPMAVMLGDYGCDDMDWLLENARVPGTVTVQAHGRVYDLPTGVFDNRVDRTSFLREDESRWPADRVKLVTEGIRGATDTMWKE